MFGIMIPHPLNFLRTRESIPFGRLHDSYRYRTDVGPVPTYRAIVAVSRRSNMVYLDSDPPVTLVPLERLGPLLDDLRLGEWLHHVCLPVVAQ